MNCWLMLLRAAPMRGVDRPNGGETSRANSTPKSRPRSTPMISIQQVRSDCPPYVPEIFDWSHKGRRNRQAKEAHKECGRMHNKRVGSTSLQRAHSCQPPAPFLYVLCMSPNCMFHLLQHYPFNKVNCSSFCCRTCGCLPFSHIQVRSQRV
jgi:hypothetical protein